jgi:hypothetical protein
MDNQLAIAIAKNPQFHNWTKHIEVQYHYIHEKVKEEEIELEYVPTNKQMVDVMTKSLCKEKHQFFTKELGVHHPV